MRSNTLLVVQMKLHFEIIKSFSLEEESIIDDRFIVENQNIMEVDVESKLMQYIPSYMLWCIKHKDSELVDMYIVDALSEYGRCKNSKNEHLNFMFRCSKEQRNTVSKFLLWCSTEIITSDKKQINKALKNWQQ